MRRTVSKFVLLAAASVAGALSAHSLQGQQPQSALAANSGAQAPQPLPPADYRLEAGDTIEVLYRTTPEYNQTVSIQPDGAVALQLVGTVPIRGLTLEDARDRIAREAAKRLNDPDISLALKDFDKPHFTVMGEVTNPGRYELRGSLSAIDGLAMAGGFKTTAKHTQIVLIHRINNTIGETQLIDYRTLEKPHKGQELIALRPGDLIIVPQSKLSKLERYVKIANTGVYYNPY